MNTNENNSNSNTDDSSKNLAAKTTDESSWNNQAFKD